MKCSTYGTIQSLSLTDLWQMFQKLCLLFICHARCDIIHNNLMCILHCDILACQLGNANCHMVCHVTVLTVAALNNFSTVLVDSYAFLAGGRNDML